MGPSSAKYQRKNYFILVFKLRNKVWLFSGSLTMYPKVKVREPERDDAAITLQDDTKSLSMWKAHSRPGPVTMTPFVRSHPFSRTNPVKDTQNDSPPLVARIPETYVPKLVMQQIPFGPMKKMKNCNQTREIPADDIEQNDRSSSVPRPRAVLSSPDNDKMVGNRNKLTSRRPSTLKNHNSSSKARIVSDIS
ncbi:unnamed protein product [Ilex paraguariensis]|uniref:Uncharacterized protein n=1 Tax=Ilex paraguariensis TaxID=185542 RepID=A0ABC8RYB2_9AQUA